MKRVLSIILVLVLMYGTTISSHAETTDETKKAISFRGIPWGCSPRVALEMIEEQFGDDIIEVQCYELKSAPYCQYDEDDKSQKAGYSIPMLKYYVKVENCTIAGYATGGFYLYFIPELSEDRQSYDLSETAGKFWRGEYVLSCPKSITVGEMRTNLSDKIDTLYKDSATKTSKTMTSIKMISSGSFPNISYSSKTVNCTHRIWQDDASQLEMCEASASSVKLVYKCNFGQYSFESMLIEKLIEQKGDEAKQKRIEDAVGTSTEGL